MSSSILLVKETTRFIIRHRTIGCFHKQIGTTHNSTGPFVLPCTVSTRPIGAEHGDACGTHTDTTQ